MRHTRVIPVLPIALVALILSACGSSQDAAQSPGSFTSRQTAAPSPAEASLDPTEASPAAPRSVRPPEPSSPQTAGSQLPSVAPTAGAPAPAPVPLPAPRLEPDLAPRSPIADSEYSLAPLEPSSPIAGSPLPVWSPTAPAPAPTPTPVSEPPSVPAEEAVQGLITRNAVWHAPASLKEGETENIALSIGDAQRLRDMINATVPSDVPRSPLPVNLTVGTVVRAKLAVISSDATVTPLDTIDKSIGGQVSLLFSWQVQPHVSGELELQALIMCPRQDGSVTTETVPFRITVQPLAKSDPGAGERLHGLLESVKNYWVQLMALVGGLAAAVRFGLQWYRGHRRPAPEADEPISHLGGLQVAPGQPEISGHTDTDDEPDDSDDLGVGVGVPQRDHQDRCAE
jgi:hypothetical protein